jgi:general secretion pathway protein N
LIGLVLTFVLQAPAAWLATTVSNATSGKVNLLEARGTVWTGSARLQFSGGAGSSDKSILPDRVNWSIRPAFNGLGIRFGADCCTPQPLALQLVPGWGRVALTVEDPVGAAPARSVWPAAMLTGLGTPWNTLQIEGKLSLLTQGLSVEWNAGRVTVAGRAELLATDVSSRLSTIKPMGSYRITLVGGNTATLEISTIEGSLQLAGSGRWVGSRLRFEGLASAAPESEAALSNLLNIIGRRSGPRSVINVG